jgi:hypothetical protein
MFTVLRFVLALGLTIGLVACDRVRFHDPFLDISSELERVATQLEHEGPGATATVRQVFQVSSDPTLFVVVPPDQLDIDALRQAANGSEDIVKRATVHTPDRTFIALASAESFKTTPIDGLTVLKQWSVRMTAGQHEIVVVLRREGDRVVVDSVK